MGDTATFFYSALIVPLLYLSALSLVFYALYNAVVYYRARAEKERRAVLSMVDKVCGW